MPRVRARKLQVRSLRLTYAALYHSFANSLVTRGQLLESLPHYQQALTVDPRHASAYSNMGVAYLRLNRYDDALFCYKRALALEPTLLTAKRNLCELLGDVLNDDTAAGACWIELAAFDPSAWLDAASTFERSGNANMARYAYDTALQQNVIRHAA